MKRNIILIAFILFALEVYCQKNNSAKNIEISQWEQLAINSIAINDLSNYITANQYLLIINPSKDTLYQKNILYAYFENKQFESCFLLSKGLSEKHKLDINFLDFYARSADQLKRYGDAAIAYEKLYVFTHRPTYGYLLANAQYYLGRFIESNQTLIALQNNPDLNAEFLDFTMAKSNQTQAVPVAAALYNLQGMVFYEMKDWASSEAAFKKAIESFPSFEVAKENLNNIHQ